MHSEGHHQKIENSNLAVDRIKCKSYTSKLFPRKAKEARSDDFIIVVCVLILIFLRRIIITN